MKMRERNKERKGLPVVTVVSLILMDINFCEFNEKKKQLQGCVNSWPMTISIQNTLQ